MLPGAAPAAARRADLDGRGRAVDAFGREWDLHAMIAGAMLTIVGTQVLSLGLCAHAYGTYFMGEQRPLVRPHASTVEARERPAARGRRVRRLRRRRRARHLARRGFGELSEERLAVLAATLFIVGLQVVFTSFLQHPGPAAATCRRVTARASAPARTSSCQSSVASRPDARSARASIRAGRAPPRRPAVAPAPRRRRAVARSGRRAASARARGRRSSGPAARRPRPGRSSTRPRTSADPARRSASSR